MTRLMKSWGVFWLMCFFVVFNSLSYVQAKGAELASVGAKTSTITYGEIEPFVGLEHSELTYGETETFVLSSKNYDGEVQYRIWLNKKDSKTWMDITGGYSEPVAARNPLIVKYDKALEPGEYTVVVWVKKAGTAGTKLNNSGLGYDKYAVTHLQCIKSDEKASKTIYNPFNEKDPFFTLVDPLMQKINAMISNSNNFYKVADVYTLFKEYKGDKPLTNFNLLMGTVDPHPTNEGHDLILKAHISAK